MKPEVTIALENLAKWILKYGMHSVFIAEVDISIENKRTLLQHYGYSSDILDNGNK